MAAVGIVDGALLGGKFRVATAGALDFMTRDNPFTSERARRELGWAPAVRPADGVPEAFRWWRARNE
jgi:nucleoside-diphosphate-sugar epimerase